MAQYLLSIYQADGEVTPPATLQRAVRDVNTLADDTNAAGAVVFNGGLQLPGLARAVRFERGDVVVADELLANREDVGGFLMVAAPDFGAALDWTARLARALAFGSCCPGQARYAA